MGNSKRKGVGGDGGKQIVFHRAVKASGVHPRVGTAAARDLAGTDQLFAGSLEGLLHAGGVLLHLPAVIVAPHEGKLQ